MTLYGDISHACKLGLSCLTIKHFGVQLVLADRTVFTIPCHALMLRHKCKGALTQACCCSSLHVYASLRSCVPAAMLFAEFLKEINGIHSFIESQKKISDKQRLEAVMDDHVKRLAGREDLTCTPENASEFVTLISKGPWSDDHKNKLGKWIHEVLMNSSPGSRKGAKRENQSIESFANYFSEKDVKCLSDKDAPLSVKLDCAFTALVSACT